MDDQIREENRTPLIGTIRPLRSLDWAELAAGNPGFFERSLRELGLRDAAVKQALTQRSEVEAKLRGLDAEEAKWRRQHRGLYAVTPPELRLIAEERDAAYRSLWDVLKGVSLRAEDTAEARVWVPLFVLSAPDVDGCSVTFEESRMAGRALGWKITLFGGLNGGEAVRATSTTKIPAENGQMKQIKAPIDLTVERSAVLQRGKDTGRTVYQIKAERSKVEATVPELIEKEERLEIGELIRSVRLSRDAAGAPYEDTLTYEWTRSKSLSLDFKVFGAQLALDTQVQQDEKFELKYILRGGHDYAIHYTTDRHGILWTR